MKRLTFLTPAFLIPAVPILGMLLAAGCTWVEVAPEARDVIVLDQARAAKCRNLGKVEVSVLNKVGMFDRLEEDIAKDLAVLARNQGAQMGGDTVSPLTGIKDGKRTFGVYQCLEPGQQKPGAQDQSQESGAQTLPYDEG